LKRSLKTKLPRYNDNDDDVVEKCQYKWQENELADFGQWLLKQLLLLAGEGRGGGEARQQAAHVVQCYCLLITARLPSQ